MIEEGDTADIYIKQERIILKGEVLELENALESQLAKDSAVDGVEFAIEHGIEREALEWIVHHLAKRNDDVTLLSGTVVLKSKVDELVSTLVDKLNLSEEPINVRDVNVSEASDRLRSVAEMSLKAVELDGTLRDGRFTPNAYRTNRIESLKTSLMKTGVLELEHFQRNGVKDPKKILADNVVYLPHYVLTAQFVDNAVAEVSAELDSKGWADLSGPLIIGVAGDTDRDELVDSYVLPRLAKKKYRRLAKQPRYVVPTSFEADVKSWVVEHYTASANQDAIALFENKELRGLEPVDLVRKLKFPDDRAIAGTLPAYTSLPVNALAAIAASVGTEVRKAYGDTARTKLEELVAAQNEKAQNRLAVYLAGIKAVHDAKLQAKLLEELAAYASKSLGTVFDSGAGVQDMEKALTSRPEPVQLEATAIDLVETQKRQLTKATDAALILHLSVLILFSKHHPGAALRATGKLVPKILKDIAADVDSTELMAYIELKDAIVAKDKKAKELAQQLKASVSA